MLSKSRCSFYYERKFKKKGFNLIIGVDEAGRGPLAGPVVAAAVCLLSSCFKNRIDDSKKLTPFQRERAFPEIIEKSVSGTGIVNEKIIDRLNILEATRMAMQEAVRSLFSKIKTEKDTRICLLVDGNITLDTRLPVINIVSGDAKSKSIACASILAKVTRDRIMSLYERLYPGYGFAKHKGYPTRMHKMQLKKIGPCLIHRQSFSGV